MAGGGGYKGHRAEMTAALRVRGTACRPVAQERARWRAELYRCHAHSHVSQRSTREHVRCSVSVGRQGGPPTLLSSRCLSPGSRARQAPERADGWVPGTRPGMTTCLVGARAHHLSSRNSRSEYPGPRGHKYSGGCLRPCVPTLRTTRFGRDDRCCERRQERFAQACPLRRCPAAIVMVDP